MSDKKKKPATSKPKSRRVAPTQFRLEQEVIDRLQRIADRLTNSTGVKHSRADAIRVLAKREDEKPTM